MVAVAWYRLRATFARDRGAYLTIALQIGLIGGLAMGATAAGRRTQSAYPRFLASTNPSDLNVSQFGANSTPTSPDIAPEPFRARLAAVKGVTHVSSLIVPNMLPLKPDGSANLAGPNVAIAGSVDGLFSDQDKVTLVHGRMWDPQRIDEFMTTPDAAKAFGLHVGQTLQLGAYTSAQTNLPDFGTPKVEPQLRINDRLVGIAVLNNQVVQDDIDRFPAFLLLSPAATRMVAADATATIYGLQLDHGGRDVTTVEQSVVNLFTPGSTYEFHVISRAQQQVERSVKPESIALAAFGLVAMAAALVIGSQAVARRLRAGEEDRHVLRAVGAGPSTTIADGLSGVVGAVIVGSLLAVAVAVALSPLAPLGPVRPVYPDRGVALDWTVLGCGFAALVVVIAGMALAMAYLRAPYRLARVAGLDSPTGSRLVRAATAAGLAPSAVVGIRFALEPGRGRTAVPARSVLVGTALTVVMVVATVTFGASLHTLVSRPALYGWNWNYALNPTNDVPPQALAMLASDRDVAAWTGDDEVIVQLDGQNVPGLLGDVRPALSPPILSGHAVDGPHQITLGAETMAALHKHVGETVTLTYGSPRDAPVFIPPTPLTIVGTATMPAAGFTSFIADHTSMGIGAVLSGDVVPAAFAHAEANPDPNLNGPQIVFVRLRPGVSPIAGRADLQRIADAANKDMATDPNATSNNTAVIGVQRPAEIVNYRSMGTTPVLLAAGLAFGASIALGLTLSTSVRRRRRDLALLKTLGFTRRQLAAAVSWQATVVAVIGVAVGVPLGIALGRQMWILFAQSIDAVPEPSVPGVALLLVGVATLTFANLVAALPGRSAAGTPAALVLRTE